MNEETQSPKFQEWAIVELFGHQKIAGRVSEATIAGGAFIRVDVPAINEYPAFTRFFGPGAIYSINPTTEAIAKAAAAYHRSEPVQRYELPKLADADERIESADPNQDPESPYHNPTQ